LTRIGGPLVAMLPSPLAPPAFGVIANKLILLPIAPEFEPELSLRFLVCEAPAPWLAGGKAWGGTCGDVSFSGDDVGLALKGEDRLDRLPPPALRRASK